MLEFKFISKDTDIDSLHMNKYKWDVVVGKNKIPYQVVDIEGYVHCIGGKWGNNSLWCYPRNEKPSYKNLIEYDGDGGADWGLIISTNNYIKSKWDETELRSSKNVMITRNGEDFYLTHDINNALHLINRINEHPISFNSYEFEKEIVGRKVWWRSQPGIIASWVGNGQACVIIKPDGVDKFETPAEFKTDDMPFYDDDDIKADIFDEHIWWFRD
jgi:hypothetical protein